MVILHDKTRLVVTQSRDLFLRTVELINDQLMAATLECPPVVTDAYAAALKEKLAEYSTTTKAWLAVMANHADPSLAVDPMKIVNPHVYLMPDKANLLFEYMSGEGMQAVSIRLDPELYRII